MKTRPIIFKAEMVRAILEGRKTQTRRVVKIKPPFGDLPIIDACGPHAGFADEVDPDWTWSFSHDGKTAECVSQCVKCPYGKPGDQLWVREACRAEEVELTGLDGVRYLADNSFREINNTPEASDAWCALYFYGASNSAQYLGRTVPSIHTPRWASRITLDVTAVRVQRVQEIGAYDAYCEGVDVGPPSPGCDVPPHPPEFEDWSEKKREDWIQGQARATYMTRCDDADKHIDEFERLWDSINAKRGFGWDTNPWVWVVEFEKMENNNAT